MEQSRGPRPCRCPVLCDDDGSILHVQLGVITEEQLLAFLREFYDLAGIDLRPC